VLAFLLPGAVFFIKIVADVLDKGRALDRFLGSLPWLSSFLLAWSFGEWVGALLGPDHR